jgi:hypothetical protein
MPTGYTYKIKEGQSFKDYAMICARAFGSCIDMRDDPIDTQIPEEFKVTNYYSKKIDEIEKQQKELLSLSDKQIQDIIDKSYEDDLKYYNEKIKEGKELRQKYQKMLEKVKNWNPPTNNHKNLKFFMKNQIESSISDCMDDAYQIKKDELIKVSVKQYKYNKIKEFEKDYEYYMKEWDKEQKRVNERNVWLKQLRKSLE